MALWSLMHSSSANKSSEAIPPCTSSSPLSPSAHTHIQPQIQTQMHAHTLPTQGQIHTCMHMRTHTTHTRTNTHAHAHTHTTHTRINTHMHERTHSCKNKLQHLTTLAETLAKTIISIPISVFRKVAGDHDIPSPLVV